jgi:3,4-dihydroxy 2-butanone 4-phosphate synthase/GTP cyclohydrolase II
MQKFESWLAQADRRLRETGRPLVSLCFAQSLDGSLALERGRPIPLSGPESKAITHRLRSLHDAILVGSGTLLADDPRLTARLAGGPHPQPVILDSNLRTPPEAAVLAGHPRPAWIATVPPVDADRRQALERQGAEILEMPPDDAGRVSLPGLLDCLGGRGVRSLMVEGGAQVLTAFLAQDLADLVSITIAPVFLGGIHSVEAVLAHMPRLLEVEYEPAGADLLVWGRLTDFSVILQP